MMSPQLLGVKPGASQTVHHAGLQTGEEMDFSDIDFAEFSEFDHRYAPCPHEPKDLLLIYPAGLTDSFI